MNRRKRESDWEDRDGLIVSRNMMAANADDDDADDDEKDKYGTTTTTATSSDDAAVDDDDDDDDMALGRKGYRSVSRVEDGIDDDQNSVESSLPHVQDWTIIQAGTSSSGGGGNSLRRRRRLIWLVPLLPDNRFTVGHVKLLDGPAAVKLLKFVLFTVLGILCMFHFIRWVVRTHSITVRL